MQRLILKTNIRTELQAQHLKQVIQAHHQITTCSVDMDDVDRVLVVDTLDTPQEELIQFVRSQGIYCAELPD